MSKQWLCGCAIVWCALVGIGLREVYGYTTSAGAPAVAAPHQWPEGTKLAPAATDFTIVMFVHPECPCTRASLAELRAIVDDLPRAHPRVIVAFATDAAGGASWDAATRIPGVVNVLDPGGVEARRFGAITSGQVLVFDAAGTLRFAGGITGSRGHQGANVGRDRVEQVLRGEPAELEHAVFGCALFDGPGHEDLR